MSQDARISAVSDATTPPWESGSVLQKLPLRVIEAAGFVAMVTAILYFMGYSVRMSGTMINALFSQNACQIVVGTVDR